MFFDIDTIDSKAVRNVIHDAELLLIWTCILFIVDGWRLLRALSVTVDLRHHRRRIRIVVRPSRLWRGIQRMFRDLGLLFVCWVRTLLLLRAVVKEDEALQRGVPGMENGRFGIGLL